MEINAAHVTQPLPPITRRLDHPIEPLLSEPPSPERRAGGDDRELTHGVEILHHAAHSSGLSLDDAILEARLGNHASYEQLRAEGKLTPEVMAALQQLATQPLAEGIDREDLLAMAIRNLADPTSINQGDRQTCAATVVQAMLAKSDPVEYLRLIAGLASPEGKVALANGDVIARDANWQLGSGKSLIDQLIQPAFMQVAAGSYDSRTDSRTTESGSGQGLYADEQEKLLEAVTGKKTLSVFDGGPEAMAALRAALADGQSVSAIIRVTDPATGEIKGHSVLIESLDGDRLTYLDPAKGRQTMSLTEFKAQIQSLSLPERYVTEGMRAASVGQGRGMLAGFLGKLIEGAKAALTAVTTVVKTVVTVVAAVVAPVVNAMKQAAAPIVGTIGQVVNTLKSQLQENGWKLFTAPFEALGQVWNGVRDFAKKAAEFWEAYGTYVIIAAQIVCAVVPGLQVVSIGLAALQALDGGKLAFEGIRTGDWKKALTGVASLAAGLAGGAGALGARALGGAATSVANIAGKVSKVAHGLAGTMEAIESRHPGKILGSLAGALGASAGLLGNEADQVVETLTRFAEKAADYSQGAEAAYQALMNGDLAGLAKAGLATGLRATRDLGGSEDLQQAIRLTSQTVQDVSDLEQALRSQDPQAALALLSRTSQRYGLAASQQAERTTRTLSQGLALMQALASGKADQAGIIGADLLLQTGIGADPTAQRALRLLKKGNETRLAFERGDVEAGTRLLGDLGQEAGLLDAETRTKLGTLAGRAKRLDAALRSGNLSEVRQLATEMGIDTGFLSGTEAQRMVGLTSKGIQFQQALARGDYAAAMGLGLGSAADAGLISGDAASRIKRLAQQGAQLKQALEQGDHATASVILGRMAVEAGIAEDTTVQRAAALARQAIQMKQALEKGDLAAATRLASGAAAEAGLIERSLAHKLDELGGQGQRLNEALRNGDYASASLIVGELAIANGMRTDTALQHALKIGGQVRRVHQALASGDLKLAAKLLGMSLPASLANPERLAQVSRALESGSGLAATGTQIQQALAKGDYATVIRILDELTATAQHLHQRQTESAAHLLDQGARIQTAIQSGDYPTAATLAAPVFLRTGILADPTAQRAMRMVRDGDQIRRALSQGDAAGVAQTAASLAREAGLLDTATAQKAAQIADLASRLEAAVPTGNAGAIAKLAREVGINAGFLAGTPAQTLAELASKGLKIQQALAKGDLEAALTLTGLIDGDTAHRLSGFASQARQIQEAIARGDYATAAFLASRMAVEAGINGHANVRQASDLVGRLAQLPIFLDRGDFVTMHRRVVELGRSAAQLEASLGAITGELSKLSAQLIQTIRRGEDAATSELAARLGVANGLLADKQVQQALQFASQADSLREAILDRDVATIAAILGIPLESRRLQASYTGGYAANRR